jgi:amino acid permease
MTEPTADAAADAAAAASAVANDATRSAKHCDPLAPLPNQRRRHEDEEEALMTALDVALTSKARCRQPVSRLLLDGVVVVVDEPEDHVCPNNEPLPVTAGNNTSRIVRWGDIANLCSATLGAGVLSLPYAMAQAGLVVGTVLLMTAAGATAASVHLLAASRHWYGQQEQHRRRPNHTNIDATSTRTPTTATAATIAVVVSSSLHMTTYESLVQHVLGTNWARLCQVSIGIFCIGCATAYCIVVRDILGFILILVHGQHPASDHDHQTLCLVAVWFVAMLPLSLLRSMRSLQCASAVGLASIGTLVLAALVHLLVPQLPEDVPNHSTTTTTTTVTSTVVRKLFQWLLPLERSLDQSLLWPANGVLSVLTACPIILFAFSCQVNVCSIFQELPDNDTTTNNNRDNDDLGNNDLSNNHQDTNNSNNQNNEKVALMQRVTAASVGICTTLYLAISFVALADFGRDNVKSNILINYSPPTGIMQVACVAMAVAVVVAYPLNIFPVREMLALVWRHHCADASSTTTTRRRPFRTFRTIPMDTTITTPNATLTAALLEDIGNPPTEVEQHEQLTHPETTELATTSPRIAAVTALTGDVAAAIPDSTTSSNNETTEPSWNWRQHMILTLLLAGSSLGLALICPDISTVFGLLGGTTTTLTGFIIPGALGIRLCRENQQQPYHHHWTTRWGAYTLVVGGIVVAVTTTLVTIYTTFFPSSTTKNYYW